MMRKSRAMKCDICGIERLVYGNCGETGFLYCCDWTGGRKRSSRRRAH